MSTIERLKQGDFNTMNQVELPDGSLQIDLIKRGDPVKYRIVVRDLYGPDEEVISDEEVPVE